jgi:Predicted transcriptional regulator
MTGTTALLSQEPKPVFLRRHEVERRVGLGRSAIYERMARKAFPLPVPDLDTETVWWLESDIDAWMAKRIERPRVGRKMGSRDRTKKKVEKSTAYG